jgi:hypothetical protein
MYVGPPKKSGNLTTKNLWPQLLFSTVSFEVVSLGLGYLDSQGDYFDGDGEN